MEESEQILCPSKSSSASVSRTSKAAGCHPDASSTRRSTRLALASCASRELNLLAMPLRARPGQRARLLGLSHHHPHFGLSAHARGARGREHTLSRAVAGVRRAVGVACSAVLGSRLPPRRALPLAATHMGGGPRGAARARRWTRSCSRAYSALQHTLLTSPRDSLALR